MKKCNLFGFFFFVNFVFVLFVCKIINKRIASLFSIRYPNRPIVEGNHHWDECHDANALFGWHPMQTFCD